MGKDHRTRSRFIEFNKKEEMMRFILMYRDLFVPYSDYTIDYESYVQDIPTYKTNSGKLMSKGHHDNNVINMMKEGYRIQNNMVKINILPEDWRKIEETGLYEKERVRRGSFKYVYVG